jgi:hypothetical protein
MPHICRCTTFHLYWTYIYATNYFTRLSHDFDSVVPYIFFRPSIQKEFFCNTLQSRRKADLNRRPWVKQQTSHRRAFRWHIFSYNAPFNYNTEIERQYFAFHLCSFMYSINSIYPSYEWKTEDQKQSTITLRKQRGPWHNWIRTTAGVVYVLNWTKDASEHCILLRAHSTWYGGLPHLWIMYYFIINIIIAITRSKKRSSCT